MGLVVGRPWEKGAVVLGRADGGRSVGPDRDLQKTGNGQCEDTSERNLVNRVPQRGLALPGLGFGQLKCECDDGSPSAEQDGGDVVNRRQRGFA